MTKLPGKAFSLSQAIREAFACLDDETLEAVRHGAENEIHQRDDAVSELGDEWPMPAYAYGDDDAIEDYRARSLSSFFDVIFRGAENG